MKVLLEEKKQQFSRKGTSNIGVCFGFVKIRGILSAWLAQNMKILQRKPAQS